MNPSINKLPKLTIGLPVYNGKAFIRKRLDNIFSQTFTDFQLIISDDSTDSTPTICKEFAKKDKRIRYIHQEKRMGWMWSFRFVLEQAKSEYFVWAGVDDIWSPDFLEKNISVLDTHKDVVGSISKIEHYGPWGDEFAQKPRDSTILATYKKFRRLFRPFVHAPIIGTYEERINFALKNTAYSHSYGVFRTNELQKSVVPEIFCWDWAIILSVLRYGKLYLIEEPLMRLHAGAGASSAKLFKQLSIQNAHSNEYIAPYSSFTIWCAKNLGIKLFIKNIQQFIWLNCFAGPASVLIGLTDLFERKILKKKMCSICGKESEGKICSKCIITHKINKP